MCLRKTTTGLLAVAVLACSGGHRALGGVIEFVEKDEWIAAVGEFTTIDFTGFPDGTFITDQYADLGILFTDGDDWIHFSPSYVNDSWGLAGSGDITVAFDTPQAWIGVDFPGLLRIELFSAGELIYTSNAYGSYFLGLVSSEPFDGAALVDPLGISISIDDLHFGVPSPGSVFLFALAGLCPRGRRRVRRGRRLAGTRAVSPIADRSGPRRSRSALAGHLAGDRHAVTPRAPERTAEPFA